MRWGGVKTLETIPNGKATAKRLPADSSFLTIRPRTMPTQMRQQRRSSSSPNAAGVSSSVPADRHPMRGLERGMATGVHPVLAQLPMDAFGASWEDTFELGLTALLDGLERRLAPHVS